MRTFTIYTKPTLHSAQTGERTTGHTWYALCDGNGGPPLVFGMGSNHACSPFAAAHCRADGEPNYLDPNTDHPVMTRTVQITRKEFNMLKLFGEGLDE